MSSFEIRSGGNLVENEIGSETWGGNADDTTLVTHYLRSPIVTDQIIMTVKSVGGATPNEFEMEWEILVCVE